MDALPLPLAGKQRIGVLGGSFNPAHEGHIHISLEALHRLQLDAIWWLVSPQNPLKPRAGMAPLAERIASAQHITRHHPIIKVTTIESHAHTRYTYDTVRWLKRHYRHNSFVWLMGADNLKQIPLWYRWEAIFLNIPVAIFDRSPFTNRVLASKAAWRFRPFRMREEEAPMLPLAAPPAWIYLHSRLHPASSTAIREKLHG